MQGARPAHDDLCQLRNRSKMTDRVTGCAALDIPEEPCRVGKPSRPARAPVIHVFATEPQVKSTTEQSRCGEVGVKQLLGPRWMDREHESRQFTGGQLYRPQAPLERGGRYSSVGLGDIREGRGRLDLSQISMPRFSSQIQ